MATNVGRLVPAQRSPGIQPQRTVDTLTSLRFFAAFAVFAFHTATFFGQTTYAETAGRLTAAGPTGVSFFFILSGFVMTWSRRSRDTPSAFYRRRFARIYPTHVLTWVGAGIVLFAIGDTPHFLSAVASLFLVHSWVPSNSYFAAMDTPSWSLCCEALFYALFPFVIGVVTRLGLRGRRLVMVGAIAVGVALVAVGPWVNRHAGFDQGYFPEFFPPARLPEFLVGITIALEIEEDRWRRIPFVPCAILALAAFFAAGTPSLVSWRLAVTLVPYALAIGATAQAEQRGARTVNWLRQASLIRLGQWSYAFYLIHGLVYLCVLHQVLGHHVPMDEAMGLFFLTLVVSVGLSALTFTFFERPLERRLRPGHVEPAALRPPGPREPVFDNDPAPKPHPTA